MKWMLRWKFGVPQAVVVVNCESSDIVHSDASPSIILQVLNVRMQMWQARANKHRFNVYGVPEPKHFNHVMLSNCTLWNEKLWKVCGELGQQLEFVSTTQAPAGGMLNSLYKAGAAEELGTHLGHKLCFYDSSRLDLQYDGHEQAVTRTPWHRL